MRRPRSLQGLQRIVYTSTLFEEEHKLLTPHYSIFSPITKFFLLDQQILLSTLLTHILPLKQQGNTMKIISEFRFKTAYYSLQSRGQWPTQGLQTYSISDFTLCSPVLGTVSVCVCVCVSLISMWQHRK
jgi:hypothetical protein